MSLFSQIEFWKEQKLLIELHLVSFRNRRRRIHGRIYSFDTVKQQILFYNDDEKKVENIWLSEIEDAYVANSS